MSNRVPFISFGDVKKRDYFQFRRINEADGPSWPSSAHYDVDYAQALKWLWRVKKWNVTGSATPAGGFYVTPHVIAGAIGVKISLGAASGSFDLQMRRKADSPTLQPVATDERYLIDGWRKDDGSLTLTRGNFGWVPPLSGFEIPAGRYSDSDFFGFGQYFAGSGSVVFLTGGTTATTGNDPTGVYNIINVSFQLSVAAAIQRWDPPLPVGPPQRINNSQLVWTNAEKIRVPVLAGFNYQALYTVTRTDTVTGIVTNVIGPTGEDVLTGTGGVAGSGSVTVDGTVFNMAITSMANHGGTGSISMSPSEFWAFRNTLNQPVYDTTSGAQINDPFA